MCVVKETWANGAKQIHVWQRMAIRKCDDFGSKLREIWGAKENSILVRLKAKAV